MLNNLLLLINEKKKDNLAKELLNAIRFESIDYIT